MIRKPFPEKIFQFLLLYVAFSQTIHAQNFAGNLPSATATDTSSFTPPENRSLSGDDLGDLLEGFDVTAYLATTYDSNIKQGSPVIQGADDDLIETIGTTIKYRTQGPTGYLGGNYFGNYNAYQNHDEFNGFSQGFGIMGGYNGTKAKIDYKASYSATRLSDINYQDFIEEEKIAQAIAIQYNLSSKTILKGSASYLESSVDTGNRSTSIFNAGLAALWQYSPLTQFGPGVRYTFLTGDLQPDRSSIGPTLSLNYKLSSKVSLSSRVGVDFTEYEGGEKADPSPTSAISLTYKGSELWKVQFSLNKDVTADYTNPGAYNNFTAYKLDYTRLIRRVIVGAGAGYEVRTTEQTDSGSNSDLDSRYLVFNTFASMPIFQNDTAVTLFANYREKSGTGALNFEGTQFGLIINHNF